MAGDLKDREVVVFETVRNMCFGQDGKNTNQGNAGQKERRRDHQRNGAGMRIDQQGGGAEPIAYDLHRECMPAMAYAALQLVQR